MSLDATRDWLKSVLRPYPARDRILHEVIDILKRYRSLAVRTDAFTFDSGQTSLLLQLHGTLPTPYKGNTYQIPVAIWLPHEYPQAPPMAFVVPTKDMGVRKGREVDPGGRITVAHEWWQDKQLQSFINRMIEVFSRQPPVYAKPPGSTSTPSRQGSVSTPPPTQQPAPPQPQPQPPREVLPQYQPSRSGSMDPGSPPVPPRPGMSMSPPPGAPAQLDGQAPPPVPHRPFPYRASMSPKPQHHSSLPYPSQHQQPYYGAPQSPGRVHSPLHAQHSGPIRTQSPLHAQHSGPPQPHPHFQPPYPPQQHQPQFHYQHPGLPPHQQHPGVPPHQQPPFQPQHPHPQHTQTLPPQPPHLQSQPQRSLSLPPPREDLLSSPNTETPALPDDVPPAAPPKPPPPSLIHLHAILQPHLNAALPALKHDLESQRHALMERREDLASGEPAIRDEMARLEAVKKVCDVVVEKMSEVVAKGEERVADLERRGEVSVDEVVCGISIAHNQLIDLVAEDNALSDTIYHLTRALDAERIDLDRYLKAVRQLAREQYMKRALIEKILNGMGQTW